MQSPGGTDGHEAASAAGRRQAFLTLEGHRERLSADLERRLRPTTRYTNLLLVSKVIRLQCSYLGDAGPLPLMGEGPGDGNGRVGPRPGYQLAEWAKPWGGTCLYELHADLHRHTQARERLRWWLTRGSRRRATAVAGELMAAISSEVGQAVRSRTSGVGAPGPAFAGRAAAEPEAERSERSSRPRRRPHRDEASARYAARKPPRG